MDVSFARKFIKQYRKLSKKRQQQFDNRLRLFTVNQHHVLLRRHALKGRHTGYYSIDISGGLRAIFKYTSSGQVVFSLIGTHSRLN